MRGMSQHTGRALDGDDHLRQSIADILTTPVGSRVMRREYGSDLPRLIDSPINGETVVELFHATAVALARWEPRLRLERVQVTDVADGALAILLTGTRVDTGGQAAELDIRIGRAT